MSDDHESRIARLEHEVDDHVRPKLHDLSNVVTRLKAYIDLTRDEESPDSVTWPMLKIVAATVLGTLGVVATVLTILHLLGKL